MANKWNISNLFKSLGNSESKGLNKELENKLEELEEALNYEVKFLNNEPTSFSPAGMSEYAGIDQQLDINALQRMYTTETWVYTAVNEISKTIASLPLKLQKKQTVVKPIKNEVTGEVEQVRQSVYIDASDEKMARRFNQPNPFTTKTEFLSLLVIDLLVCGEYFIYIDSDIDLSNMIDTANGDENSPFARLSRAMTADLPVNGFYRLPPTAMRPVASKDKMGIEGFTQQTSAGFYFYKAAEVIHVKLPNPIDAFRGLSPLVPAFKPVLLDRFSTEHMVRFYKTGARLGGVIKTEKSLNKEQLGRFQRSFEANFTGRKNHHRTLILPPGMEYQQIEQNPAETALLEFCKYNREAILSVYHVPPIKVGILDNANYANALVQLKIFFTDTVKPLLSFIEDGFNIKSSIMPLDYKVVFDLSEVEALKEDYNAMADMALKMVKAGLTVNEIRKMVWKKEPIAKGDRAYSIAEIDRFEGGSGGGFLNLAAPKDDVIDKELSTEAQSALIHTDVAGPGPKKPCDKCKKEPCECPDKGKKTLGEFITESIAKLDSGEQITPEFLADLVSIYNQLYSTQSESKETPVESTASIDQADAAPTQQDIIEQPKVYDFGLSKDHVVEHWKTFITKTDPMVEQRQKEIAKWFKSLKSLLLNRIGANIKSFGLHKARNEDDVNEILNEDSFEGLIKEYIKDIDNTLAHAFAMGYADTLVSFSFGKPNQQALEFIKQYGAAEVKHILDTTRDQMRKLLTDSFEQGVAVGEVAARVQEKFSEIEEGRAWTIARTETLSAVSAGQDRKRADFKERFPKSKLMKMWVSAQDDRVRDSHQELDGQSVAEDEEFSNGLKYPREKGGEASEIINCRCTVMSFVSEDQGLVDETLPTKEDQEE